MTTFAIFSVISIIYALIGFVGISKPDYFPFYILAISIASIICPIAAIAILPSVNFIAIICFEVIGLTVGSLVGAIYF